jgi:hypothetical protein
MPHGTLYRYVIAGSIRSAGEPRRRMVAATELERMLRAECERLDAALLDPQRCYARFRKLVAGKQDRLAA